MQKVQFTAMIPIALSALVIAGCASQQQELESVKTQIGDLQTTNEKLQDNLQKAGLTIGDLKKQIMVLQEPKKMETGFYTTLTYNFKSWEPADHVKGEIDARTEFWKRLDAKITEWETRDGLFGKKGPGVVDGMPVTVLTISSNKRIINTEEKAAVEADIKALIGTELGAPGQGVKIAATEDTTDEPVDVRSFTSNLVSVSAGVANKPECDLQLVYKPTLEGAISSTHLYWHYRDHDGLKGEEHIPTKDAVSAEIAVPVGGTKKKARLVNPDGSLVPDNTDVCIPSESDEKTVYIMVVTTNKTADGREEPKAAHYRILKTQGLKVTTDTLHHAPLTKKYPGCPPTDWNSGDAEQAGAFFRAHLNDTCIPVRPTGS